MGRDAPPEQPARVFSVRTNPGVWLWARGDEDCVRLRFRKHHLSFTGLGVMGVEGSQAAIRGVNKVWQIPTGIYWGHENTTRNWRSQSRQFRGVVRTRVAGGYPSLDVGYSR